MSSVQDEMVETEDLESTEHDTDWASCEESAEMSDDDIEDGSKNTVRYVNNCITYLMYS